MSDIPNKTRFADMYSEKAPWDIPGPQPGFVQAADQASGAVLDCGCGTGENALFFASRGHQVTGVDFLEEPIRRAMQKAADRRLTVDFRVQDALHLAEMNQTFDTAIDCGLFHTFSDDDRKRYVASLSTAVKPGGRLLLMCFSDEEPPGFGPRRVSQAELRAAFATGWTIDSIAPAQLEVIPEVTSFSEGGPKAWFLMATRGAG